MAEPDLSSDVQPTGRPNKRMRQTVWDMVRSMAVVLAVVFVIVSVQFLRAKPDEVKVVDASPVVALAAAQAAFPVQAPTGLPDGWRATSARWQPTEKSGDAPVLHVGYVTPADDYAQVSESTARSVTYLAEQTDQGESVGQQQIGEVTWEKWEAGDRRSLLNGSGSSMIIVSGTASWDELQSLAASLVPAASGS